ncbi:hypothetical protein Pmar_PMAR003734 [Perkinsus marinus ATCC 50983]|uniref:Uncharacterized protein n=1 Tax=Perkinsus marinus (strain ATCC 50983 / TXsc) TaxID=423536 RepID=C5KI58_PERM5|nr:hypothetical protein Pmar_PMAR003734 [Perkinsus marinus ATCC 50983]EER16270.1 hypothetical protein Pmar_PMAR003734 [Perkinsus marinus ATCC 50983]|eukprot:XP_002784474.1 hypothetical protein Pmar_PMAR003734 [Perkinsus marinus ATCC 50983]
MANTTAAERIRAGLDAVHEYIQPVVEKARPVVTEAYSTVRTTLVGLSERAQIAYEKASPVVQKWYQDSAQPAARHLYEQAKPYTRPLEDLYGQTITTAGVYSRQLLGDQYGSYVERALPNVFIALAISGLLWVGITLRQSLGRSDSTKMVTQVKESAKTTGKSRSSSSRKQLEPTSRSTPVESDHEKTKKQRTPRKGGAHKQPKKAPVFPKPESLAPKPKKTAANKDSSSKAGAAPASHGKKATTTTTDADGWNTVTGKRR